MGIGSNAPASNAFSLTYFDGMRHPLQPAGRWAPACYSIHAAPHVRADPRAGV